MRNGPINARVVETLEFGPDPRGWSIFTRINAMLGRARAGARRVVDPIDRWSGISPSPQAFTGAGNLGTARPVTVDTSTLADERAAGILASPAERMFLQRLGQGGTR